MAYEMPYDKPGDRLHAHLHGEWFTNAGKHHRTEAESRISPHFIGKPARKGFPMEDKAADFMVGLYLNGDREPLPGAIIVDSDELLEKNISVADGVA